MAVRLSPLAFLALSCLVLGSDCRRSQRYSEELFLKHLPDGRVSATFQFTTTWDVHPLDISQPSNVRHYGIFPKSLAEVIGHYQVQELHLTLTQGQWRTRMWGYSPHPAPPGAELWAWFLPDAQTSVQWPGLVEAMSGLLGTHLNAIDPSSTYQPLFSFRPHGAIIGNLSSLRYAALPRETVCTENFTPWTKLLACGSAAGLGTLFHPLKLYDSDYHSLGLHVTPFCKDSLCSEVGLSLLQTLSIVFPSPTREGAIKWSLRSLFSHPLISSCPLASISRLTVETDNIDGLSLSLTPPPSSIESALTAGVERQRAIYDLPSLTENSTHFDMTVMSNRWSSGGMPASPPLQIHRHLTGSGHEWGGLTTEISNLAEEEVEVLYLDMVPWFCRVYLHTLAVSGGTTLHQHYVPAKDRARPHTLELHLLLPPSSITTVSFQFSRAFLKWTEHKPDAHHGFYINSAVLTAVLTECSNCSITMATKEDQVILQLYSEPVLVSLPTPDFSMPYNVLCFVCTIIAIGFGSIFNLTTRTLQPAPPGEERLLARILRRLGIARRS